jgi:hypothetical protein
MNCRVSIQYLICCRYYIHPAESSYLKEILFLPLSQVQALIDEIASTFKVEVSVPSFPFTVTFFDDGTPQPGPTMSRADVNEMQDSIPLPAPGHGEPPEHVSPAQDLSFKAWKEKMEEVDAAKKKKSAATKRKKAEHRLQAVEDLHKQLWLSQRVLGFRKRTAEGPLPDSNLSWEEQEQVRRKHDTLANAATPPLDLHQASPFSFEGSPIIISIDVESYERDHKIITEIGISTLDTLDLHGVAVGQGGENWMKHIRSRHFRIKEYAHLENKEFVRGHANGFQFGKSEFISRSESGKMVDGCFRFPFSVAHKHDGILKNVSDVLGLDSTEAGVEPQVGLEPVQKGEATRSIVLVGHDVRGDILYLSQVKSKVFEAVPRSSYLGPMIDATDADNPVYNIWTVLDTADMYKALCRKTTNSGLTSMMTDLGRTAWYAHNAGNDARYTMEAFIGIAIKARQQEDNDQAEAATIEAAPPGKDWEAEKADRLTARLGIAKREAEEEFQAWDRAANQMAGDDEGDPKSFSAMMEALQKSRETKLASKEAQRRAMTKQLEAEEGIKGPADFSPQGEEGH